MASPTLVQETANASPSAASATTVSVSCTAATAGNVLLYVMAGDKNTGTLTVTDNIGTNGGLNPWTVEVSLLSTSVSLYVAYKTAVGGETSVTGTWTTVPAGRATAQVIELTGGGSGNWVVAAKATNITAEAVVSSWSTGTTGAATADGFAVAVFAVDNSSAVTTGTNRAWTNSYTEIQAGTSGIGSGDAGLFTATKTIASGATTETTLSWTPGTQDQTSGAVVVFGRTSSGVVVTVGQRWIGVDAATVKVSNGTGNHRIAFSTASNMASPTYTSSTAPDSNGVSKHTLPTLTADTLYYYQVEVNGTLVDTVKSFRTLPGTSSGTSFTFAFSSCRHQSNNTPSPNPPVLADVISRGAKLFLQTGDFHYQDISTNSPASFRTAYDELHTRSNIENVLSSIPTAYTWSDHDFGGNGSDTTTASKPAAQSVYRERVPHPTLPAADGGGIYHTFRVGRARFIVLDGRSYRSPFADTDDSSKTMLGTAQKTWLQGLLATPDTPLTFIVSEVTWIGTLRGDDFWAEYQTERAQIAAWITASTTKVVMLCGDAHCLAIDDGTNAAAGVHVWIAAPLNQTMASKGGPYSGGTYTAGTTGVYGYVTVTDSGSTIAATYQGIRGDGTVWNTDTVTATVATTGAGHPVSLVADETLTRNRAARTLRTRKTLTT